MKLIRIGGVSAHLADSAAAMPQLLNRGGGLDYLVFDNLAEAVMPMLARRELDNQGPGYVDDFVDVQIIPHLAELLKRKLPVIANAGGLDPEGCAQRLRRAADALGLHPRIAVITGDNLIECFDDFVLPDTRDMFDRSDVYAQAKGADRILTLTAYTGAFPIAAALKAGADIVIAGRCVDSAPALGALIHAFDWGPDEFDKLAAGTLAGHLLECSIQSTGGFFTDWDDVPNWQDIGFPIAECSADGIVILTKPPGTGGLVSRGTVAEQMVYEVGDPSRYVVPDVVVDFSHVRLTQDGADRVRLEGVKGWGRPASLKVTLCYDRGWRGQFMYPVLGREAARRAMRIGTEFLSRTRTLLKQAQLPDWEGTEIDVVGANTENYTETILRVVADHADIRGAQMLAREQTSLGMLGVGTALSLGISVRPIQRISSFLVPREHISLEVSLDGVPVEFEDCRGGVEVQGRPKPTQSPHSDETALDAEVPLVDLAWVRSGDKGDLFNVGIIARDEKYLPYISAALNAETVAEFYTRRLRSPSELKVVRYELPGIHGMNFVVESSLEGGMSASRRLDPAAKGYGQMLLDLPVRVARDLLDRSQRSTE